MIQEHVEKNENDKKELSVQTLDIKEQLQSLAHNLLKVQEEEKKWFSRELHDEIGQWLTAVYAEAEAITNKEKIDSHIREGAQSIKYCVNNMHKVIHSLMHELRPVLLDTVGLSESLYDLNGRWSEHNPDISSKVTLEGDFKNLDGTLSITIYRIIQEALNNISKHANATRVVIHLNRKVEVLTGDDMILLSIEDNGRGFNQKQQPSGFGVLGMRERANAVHGTFSLYSAPSCGTQISAKFPVL